MKKQFFTAIVLMGLFASCPHAENPGSETPVNPNNPINPGNPDPPGNIFSLDTPGAPLITASDGLLTVQWTAVKDAESYNVYLGTEPSPPAKPVKTVMTTSTVLNELTNKTVYYVWIKAINQSGSSDFSPRSRGVPWADYEIPTTPGTPVIIPGINQLTVNWEE
jgi:hypothetical protein